MKDNKIKTLGLILFLILGFCILYLYQARNIQTVIDPNSFSYDGKSTQPDAGCIGMTEECGGEITIKLRNIFFQEKDYYVYKQVVIRDRNGSSIDYTNIKQGDKVEVKSSAQEPATIFQITRI